MGGEGSMAAANNSLKNNRNLLKKNRKNALSGSYANLQLKEFPNATPEQLIEIKENMKREEKQIRKKLILAILLIISFLFFLYALI
ncbi:hypothetical protein [Gelatiniphilus marinus]|uniref:Uncharacterized protein n=1 Tax=Gelatiniphilus marinus TaxID=1759464 RepID=A0ABW5JL36_9FLAO